MENNQNNQNNQQNVLDEVIGFIEDAEISQVVKNHLKNLVEKNYKEETGIE